MRVVLVGSGNVATNLGFALQKVGHEVVQVYSLHLSSARELAQKLGIDTYTDSLDTLPNADLVILSVKDDAVETVAARVAERYRETDTKPIVIHTAGSMCMDLIPMARKGVIYPMQTFSKSYRVDFQNVPLFVEASDPATEDILMKFAQSLSEQVYKLSSADRQYLHLAAVFCCNFANHCMDMGATLLEKHGIPFRVMLPLIDETTKKLHTLLPREAQTGPAVRKDGNVLSRQMGILQRDGEGDLASIYQLLSRNIQKLHSYDK